MSNRDLAAHQAKIAEAARQANPPCFKCGDPTDGDYERALVIVECQDSSFSGSFTIPLCETCKMDVRDNGKEVLRA